MTVYRSKLRLSGNVTLDASGNGQVALSPDRASVSWEVTRIAVRTTQGPTQTPFPQAELYDSPVPVASSSYGATASGHNDVFDPANDPIEIGSNDAVLIVWTGGIPGTVATVTIRGHILLERLWDGVIRLSAVRYSPVPLSSLPALPGT